MTIREMREKFGYTQQEFANRYNIPFRTVQNWELGLRKPPEYILRLLNDTVQRDLTNRRSITLPVRTAAKKDLPQRSEFAGASEWLLAVNKCLGDNFVFALDEALMCMGYFLGRSDEYLMWGYGDDNATAYNGVVLLGNKLSPHDVETVNGLRCTSFNRTVIDALANERIFDMQGITEALSNYYFANDESFRGITVPPEYSEQFERLTDEAMSYYEG